MNTKKFALLALAVLVLVLLVSVGLQRVENSPIEPISPTPGSIIEVQHFTTVSSFDQSIVTSHDGHLAQPVLVTIDRNHYEAHGHSYGVVKERAGLLEAGQVVLVVNTMPHPSLVYEEQFTLVLTMAKIVYQLTN